MGVFKKPAGSGELHLAACFPDKNPSSLEERIKQIQDNCGWTLKLTDDICEVQKPTVDEINLLREFIPPHM
jgi:hypothetical protein